MFLIEIYNVIFYQPLFNILIWLYNNIPGNDIGLAIIALTVIIRVVLFPLYYQSIKSQRSLQELQPKIEQLKKQYKDQKEKMSAELMNLYKAEKVNPFSSCLPLLIQLPFLFAVYQVFRSGLNSQSLDILYPFVANPGHINPVTLGFFNLAETSLLLAILAGAAQFWQAKMMFAKKPPLINGKEIEGAKDEKMMATMNKQMIYFMPIFTVVIGATLPAGLTLYWLITTFLMALQQLWMFNKKQPAEQMPESQKIIDIIEEGGKEQKEEEGKEGEEGAKQLGSGDDENKQSN